MKNQIISLFAVAVIITSCQEKPKDYIEQINPEDYYPDISQGVTVKQSNEGIKKIDSALKANTLNKYLPEVWITDKNGRKINLQVEIKQNSVLMFNSIHCSFCKIAFFEHLPIVMDSLKSRKTSYSIYPILSSHGLSNKMDSTTYFNYKARMDTLYPTNYTIDLLEENKLNIIANPYFLYINKEQQVTAIKTGLNPDDPMALYKQIVENLELDK